MNTIEVSDMIRDQLQQWGLAQQGWKFAVGRGIRTLGSCCYETRTIKLSKHLVARGTYDEIKRIILHEVAHALAGPGTNHGPEWRRWAEQIGVVDPTRCENVAYTVPKTVGVFCGICHQTISRRHKKMNLTRLAISWCKQCGRESMGRLRLISI